jgi:Na+-transporting methylmalonyl-CoA/oxaloacetate decarboxylase gamma subunit
MKRGEIMSLSASILVAFFCMAVVFTVLCVLWALIRLFSSLIRFIEKSKENKSLGQSLK